MQYLYKLFHQYDHTEFIKRYEHRISTDSIMRFNLSIKPMDQPHIYDLYYIPTNNIVEKTSEIYRISGQLNMIFGKLPSVAKDQFILECLVEELYNTNELEGVQSTRDEIVKSIRNVKLKKKDNKRFNSMVKLYMSLINGDKFLPSYSSDIRKIYDEITEGEIEKGELPDGEIFRKDVTHILKKSGSGKVIHRGIFPESKIISEVEKLLKVMNDLDGIPLIIRVAIGHYFFGYIHPFYDGNGRTSRFISSIYLAETLGEIPALSLSRGSNKFKNKYLDAFEITNSIMTRGEMNYFIDVFLDIILKTLTEMNTELKEKVELINSAYHKLKDDPDLNGKGHFEFMFILAQNHFFHYNDGLAVKELAHEMELSEVTIRKIAKALIDKSFIIQNGLRPAYFTIDPVYFENK